MKKREIQEVLDSDGNLIGNDDKPSNNPNEIGADGTTDHNVGIGQQHFAHDFLGRFGFYMFNENEGDEPGFSTDDFLTKIAKEAYVYFDGDDDNLTPFESMNSTIQDHYLNFAKKVMNILNDKPQIDVDPTLSEAELSKMIEDVITKRTDRSLANKGDDNDIMDSKVKGKLKSLLSTLSDKDKGDLINHLKK